MNTTLETIEGTWEEIARQAGKFDGHRLRVTILPDDVSPSPPDSEETTAEDPTPELFEQWAREDAQMTSEEREEEDRLWERFEQNINDTRAASGMRTL